jgi:hypothetical protein
VSSLRRSLGTAVACALLAALATAPNPSACGRTPRDAAVRYYRGIDNGDFRAAWRCLSSATRDRFGGFRQWRSGSDDTVWTRLTFAMTTDQAAGVADVRVRLRSCTDRGHDVLVESFRGTWEALNGCPGWRLHNPRPGRPTTLQAPVGRRRAGWRKLVS